MSPSRIRQIKRYRRCDQTRLVPNIYNLLVTDGHFILCTIKYAV